MKLSKQQAEAAKKWAAEMLDRTVEHDGEWTSYEVGEYHEAGVQAVMGAAERARLNGLFEAAGAEEGLVTYLNAR